MRSGRTLIVLAVLIVAAAAGWWFLRPKPVAPGHLTVYYTKIDGNSLGTWTVSLRPPQAGEGASEHLHNVALYAAVQSVAGPPSDVNAIRFPLGTTVRNVIVNGSTATVDLSKDVGGSSGGSFAENGEFKGLVYTLTGIPPINAVQVLIEGRKVETLPGGHLELDSPLCRSDW